MKKLLFTLFLVAFKLFTVLAIDTDVKEIPATVLNAFKIKYGEVKNVKWEMENADFEAEFKLNSKKMSAIFTELGEFVHQEVKIKNNELAIEADKTLQNLYPGYRIDEIELVTTASGSEYYELQIEVGEKSYEIEVTKEGKILNLKNKSETEAVEKSK